MRVKGNRGIFLFTWVIRSYEEKELQLDLALESIKSQIAQEREMKPSKVNNCLFGAIREVTVAVLRLVLKFPVWVSGWQQLHMGDKKTTWEGCLF